MRGEEGEVILEGYGKLLALSPQTCTGTQPREGSVNQETSMGSAPARQN